MGELFELVFEYRSLLARREVSEEALNLPERRRLDALGLLLGQEPITDAGDADEVSADAGRRRHARCEVRLEATLRIGARLVRVDVVNLGAGGVCVAAREPIERDTRGALRIRTPESGHVYECLARTAWVSEDGTQAGLRFVGAPIALRLAS